MQSMEFKPEELSNQHTNHSLKGTNFVLGGESAKAFMTSLIEIFKQNGGKDFLTMTFGDTKGNKYGVTIQNCNGNVTPHEKINELEVENAQLRQRIVDIDGHYHEKMKSLLSNKEELELKMAELENDNADMLGFLIEMKMNHFIQTAGLLHSVQQMDEEIDQLRRENKDAKQIKAAAQTLFSLTNK